MQTRTPRVWMSYAWIDNANSDVDFVAQKLEPEVTVKLDRWNLVSGQRLWPQIEKQIVDPDESDGWILYATPNSLGSEACKEEFAYALDRALQSRGSSFPVVALFPSRVERSLIPAGIRTRLFVSLTDPDWKERIVAAVQNRAPQISRRTLLPYFLQVHRHTDRNRGPCLVIETRPRAGVWSPAGVVILKSERQRVQPEIWKGATGKVPGAAVIYKGETTANGEQFLLLYANEEITPTQSLYTYCTELPSMFGFGVYDGAPQYQGHFDPSGNYIHDRP